MKKKIIIILGIVLSIIIFIIFYTLSNKDNPNTFKIDSRITTLEEHINKDENIVSWIKVSVTNIDYPVIYGPSVDKSQVEYDFAWINRKEDTLSNRTVLFGHNILNVSSKPLINAPNHRRFEQLMGFIYKDFAKENQFIQYTVDNKDYIFRIFSVSFVLSDELDKTNLTSIEKRKEYINKSLDDSMYTYDINVDENDKLITLVTCTRFFGNDLDIVFKIDARLIREDEKLSLEKLKVKEKYKILVEEGRFSE